MYQSLMPAVGSLPVNIGFFLIGAPKSGSTWLAQCLDEHPEITVAKGKETDFFVDRLSVFDGARNPSFMSDWRRYADLFRHAEPNHVLGDCSINMLHNVESAPAIVAAHYPNSRMLVILRNPVSRTYSHYWHERLYDRRRGVPNSFEEAIENEKLVFRSRYFEQLKVWYKFFPGDQFHFILDTEVRDDAVGSLRRVFDFLGVSSSFVPGSAMHHINTTAVRSRLLVALMRASDNISHGSLAPLVRAAHRIGVVDAIKRNGMRHQAYPPMRPETGERLRNMLRDDIERLQDLIGRDLREWLR